MAINQNTTIITALFDIGRDKWENFTMSYHTYLHWMDNTLFIDCNMVIYTEEQYKERILQTRLQVDPLLQKTKLVISDLKELCAYKLFNTPLEQLMHSETFIKKTSFDVPEMTQPLYNVIMFGKMYFLKDTYENNYFPEQKYLLWADAGGLRESITNYKRVLWPNQDKFNENKITFFSHHLNISIQTEENHALSQMRFIQGTCFIVPVQLITDFTKKIENIVFECIDKGYIGSDEKILDFFYLKNQERCELIKSTWREYYQILK